MNINFILISFIFLSTLIVKADATFQVDLIRNRLTSWAVSYPTVGDLPRKSVAEYLALLNPDGSFSDAPVTIDIMTGRLLFMAQAFKNDPAWKNNFNLKTNLYSAVQFWLDRDPGHSGWTDGCFKEPSAMDSIGLCLYDDIQIDKVTSPELNSLMDGMIKWANAAWFVNNACHFYSGANITYRLMGMIGRAALANSPEMFDDITNILASTFKVGKLYDTGIMADGSWHEYNVDGGQNYWLGYGRDWLHLTLKYCECLKGTRWELSDCQLNFLADGIVDGWQWLVYRNQGVYSLGGRHNLLKSALQDNGFMVGQIDSLRRIADPEILVRNDELELVKNRMANSSVSDPSFDDSKFFYKSDLMIFGKPDYYVATKMLSNRTSGPESNKGEARKNFHFADGSTLIFNTGKEYKNARVAWNFSAIPGITAEQKNDDLPNVDFGSHANGLNSFAGGIADGDYAVCAFKLHRANKYSKVTANKSYFFFNNGFVALGSEIKKRPPFLGNEVWTTIDQPERKSDIKYFINGVQKTIPLNSNVQLDFTNTTDGAWFYCNGNGYIIFPDKNGVNLKLWAENRTGDWHDLDIRYSSGDTQSVNIFQLSINHFDKPKSEKYAYLIFPNITEKKLKTYFNNSPVKILENSDNVQAVQFSDSNITEIVFYNADSILLNSPFSKVEHPGFASGVGKGDLKSGLTVSVNKPAIVMLELKDNQLKVSIADPNQFEENIVMTINAKLEAGKNIVYNPKTGASKITFTLPQDIFLGKSLSQNFVIIKKYRSL